MKAGEGRSLGHGSDSSDEDGGSGPKGLETIVDDEDGEPKEQRPGRSSTATRPRGNISRKQSTQSLAGRSAKQAARSSSVNKEKSGTPSSALTGKSADSQSPTEISQAAYFSLNSLPQVVADIPGTATLSEDVRFFLAYHHDHVTYNHYFLKQAATGFIQKSIIEYAMEYEPLLYALVGFSAYHYTLKQPRGKLHTFLRYYNRSVSLLRKSLQAGARHSRGMLMTILQLATFEVGLKVSLILLLIYSNLTLES